VVTINREIELILNSTHDAMIAVDKNATITLYNKAAGILTNKDPIASIGKKIVDVIENTRLPYILETGESELNKKQKLEDIMIVTNRMPVKNEKGEVVGAIAVFRDITEFQELAEEITDLKEVQGMLEAIFNSTNDAISVIDQFGYGVLVNPAYTKLTGYSSKDIVGKHCTVDLSEGESVHLRVLATGKELKGARLKVGPNKKDVVADAAPILVNGELRGSVAVIHDLSYINQLRDELDQAKQIIRNLEAKYTFDDIKGTHHKLINAIDKSKLASKTPATIILRGESGTGKELFAHAIHNLSKRKYSQFVRVNCAAINESILESELFGYEEGAFTGAIKGGKKGIFERADGGTIFLDEIGEISLNMQAKLLRVLQEKEIVRVGGTKAIPVDVRIISATNVDLEKAVSEKMFRKDLYYRLNVFPIMLPALREHKSDIPVVTNLLIKKFNQEYGRNVKEISNEALSAICEYDWPGNVRELENYLGRVIINMKMTENEIKKVHLPSFSTLSSVEVEEKVQIVPYDIQDTNLSSAVDKFEKRFIEKILEKNDWNREKTAKELGVSIRNLYYKLKKYEILK
jgi:PAS domain S-box-containing protein